jgi:hypothetical protein
MKTEPRKNFISKISQFVCFFGILLFICKSNGDVTITNQSGKVSVFVNGNLFTEYIFTNTPRPFLYPVIGPGGLKLTRDWPIVESSFEEHDHPHHKSLWFAHGDVNGVDFWTDGPNKGKIVHDSFILLQSGSSVGIIHAKNNWISPRGEIILIEDRLMKFHGDNKARFIDFEITLRPAASDVVLGDTKEGTMAIRIAESMRLRTKSGLGKGHIVNSSGVKDDLAWGKRADWCDYYGPVGSNIVGIAIFDHPKNPRHPTWWHVRDYGLFAANPFGMHDFEKAPPNAGNLKIKSGESVTFRYRFYFHNGNTDEAEVAKYYEQYTNEN